jgi:hypothetical protein
MEVAARAVVLVEGESDRRAIETLARRRGRDLAAEDVSILAMGGAHAVRAYLERLGPAGRNLRLAGLCDAGEERHFRGALEGAGLGSSLTRRAMEALGFYVCEADLEDALIRALGAETVERVIEAEGDLASFRTYQKQPAHRDRSFGEQVHGFMWNRKQRFARVLVEALDLERVPHPLDGVLAHVDLSANDLLGVAVR